MMWGFPVQRPLGSLLAGLWGLKMIKKMQLAVLRETLTVLAESQKPGEIRHLPFEWPEDPKKTDWHPAEISPIIKMNLEAIKKMKV